MQIVAHLSMLDLPLPANVKLMCNTLGQVLSFQPINTINFFENTLKIKAKNMEED